jgi:hypothetical protein
MDFNAYVKQYVEDKIAVWQQKGEFEKTSTYKARVNEQSRRAEADRLATVALDDLKKIYAKSINWSQFTLQKYDADNETFLLQHPIVGRIALPVGITSAQSFKQNFNRAKYSGADFVLANNKFNLTKLAITDIGNNKKFYYNNAQSATYVAQNIDYNFSAIEVNMPKTAGSYKNNTNIKQQSMSVGSDPVDVKIPNGNVVRQNTFAIIIGNEKYNNERSVPYAVNDATILKKYVVKTLGLPAGNVHLVTNATLGQMYGQIKWITDVAKAYNGNASLIVYYAGHGMPDETSKDAYLLPVDGNSTMPQTAIKLDYLYKELNKYPTKQITVLLDACFSGGAREGMLAEGRGVKIRPKENTLTGNMVVLSAATGDQTAFPYKAKGHGLFTYYVLKKLQDTNGNITIGGLSDYVKTNVSRKAVIENSKPQNPKVNVSYPIQNTWRNLKLAY